MKITTLIMLVFLIQVSAATKAQVTLNAKNEPIRNVLKSISKQSGYDFIYTDQDLDNTDPVTITLNNVSLDKALEACFRGQPLIYEISDKAVMVKRKEDKPIVDRVKDFLTALDIHGRIVDERLLPLPGATVQAKGSGTSGTTTDGNGNFKLKNVQEKALIQISFIGYKTIELDTKLFMEHPEGMTIQMKLSDSKLDEVQVQAYGTTSRRLSTGDISTIKAADIAKQPVDNPLYALQGRIPGLIITPTSGNPGASVTVQIRGQNSLVRNSFGTRVPTQPLFVIDGVPYTNNIPGIGGTGNAAIMSAFSFINPSDIESIDVLKDADATAIYGSRGANGVILITTKKGKIGSTRVDASVSTGYGRVAKEINLLNTPQYLQMRKEAFANDGIDFNSFPYSLPSFQAGLAPDLFVWDQNRYTDWQKQLIGGTAAYHNAQASVSGGSATIQYRLAGNFSKQGYVYPGEAKYENGGGSFSITGISNNQKFRATLTGDYTANESVSPPNDFTRYAMQLPPNAPSIYASNGALNWEPNPVTGLGTWYNPYAVLLRSATTQSNALNSNLDISYKLMPNLTLKTTAGFSDVRGTGYIPQPILSTDPKRWTNFVRNSTFTTNSSESWTVEPQVLYNAYISKGRMDVVIGGSIQSQNVGSTGLTAVGFNDDSQLRNWVSATSFFGTNTSSQYKYAALFGRLSYNWDDTYLLNLSARRDGSSRFGPGKKWGNFGSFGAAWIFTKTDFIQHKLPFLSFGKLRGSYGVSGNDGIGDYGYVELFANQYPGITYQGSPTLSSGGAVNPDYSWETTYKGEVGLELGFLKDRIVLSASYYRNRSSNLLGQYTLPVTAGAPNFTANQDAKIQNSGGEFTLYTANIKNRNFTWSSSFNLSIQRNKLLALPNGSAGSYGNLGPGNPVGQPYSGVQYVAILKGVDPQNGLYQFETPDGKISSDPFASRDTKRLNTAPTYFGGLANTLTYKGFSLDVFLQFTKQMGANYIYSQSFGNPNNGGPGIFVTNSSSPSYYGNQPAAVLGRWQKPGDNSAIQRFSTNGFNLSNFAWSNAAGSDAAWVDASFIRVKNISLSYSIPDSWKQKMKLQNVRLYIQGQNLWTFTKYKGLDPETQSVASLPPLRLITTGIQIGL